MTLTTDAGPSGNPRVDKWYDYSGRIHPSRFASTRAASEFDNLRRCINAVVTQWNRIVELEELDLDSAKAWGTGPRWIPKAAGQDFH